MTGLSGEAVMDRTAGACHPASHCRAQGCERQGCKFADWPWRPLDDLRFLWPPFAGWDMRRV